MTAKAFIAAAGVAVLASAVWWRKNPSACPYAQRFWVEPPHPLITRARLRDTLQPRTGEHMLEVGPGTGYYTLDVAEWVLPGGAVDIFDLQQEMLDHTERRALERGIGNLTATQGDARQLPYPDASFDGAYLVAVLGEVPDQDAALRQLGRVLKPGGRPGRRRVDRRPSLGQSQAAREAGRCSRAGLRASHGHAARLLRPIRAPAAYVARELRRVAGFSPVRPVAMDRLSAPVMHCATSPKLRRNPHPLCVCLLTRMRSTAPTVAGELPSR